MNTGGTHKCVTSLQQQVKVERVVEWNGMVQYVVHTNAHCKPAIGLRTGESLLPVLTHSCVVLADVGLSGLIYILYPCSVYAKLKGL